MEYIEIEPNDAYRDLGYIPRNEIKQGLEEVQKQRGEIQKAVNRVSEIQDDRRGKNFELVKELDPTLIDEGQGTVSLTILGRVTDFHLPSNTFYSHAKQRFGYGIEQQVRIIQNFLKGKK
jgi:hypothetical protein